MIVVLPLLLYPLLGMSFFQVVQFMHEHPSRVKIIGLPSVGDLPAAGRGGPDRRSMAGRALPGKSVQVELQPHPAKAPTTDASQIKNEAEEAIRSEAFQVVDLLSA